MYAIIYVVALLCTFASLAEASSLRVAPILLDVSAPGATTTLNLRNEGDQKLYVQIRIFRWTGTQSEPSLEPTSDVVVSPPAATLTPGTEYVVRVGRVAKQPIVGEESYRIRCGDNLTRDNVMKVVANMDFEINTYIPGIRIKTSPTDFYPIEQVQMMRFTGEKWQLFGPIIDGHAE